MPEKKNELGNALRAARLKKNYSQEQLAERLDITVTHLQHIESGFRKPSIELFFSMIRELDFSTDNFLMQRSNSNSASDKASLLLMISKCNSYQLAVLRATAQALLDNEPLQNSQT